jgi:regulator of nucleoside diphosphate kinase
VQSPFLRNSQLNLLTAKNIVMNKVNNQLFIAHEDYEILNNYVRPVVSFNRGNAVLLLREMKNATIINKNELPQDVIRLNSKVIIKEESKNKLIELVLVVPEKADIHQNMVSVFAPIGVALIGFKQGEKVNCSTPSGNKSFTILEVCNKSAGA